MKRRCRRIAVMLWISLLVVSGCGKKGDTGQGDTASAAVSAEQITAIRNSLAQGMKPIGFGNVKASDAGKQCLVEARTPEGGVRITPPPPPLGMVRTVGQVTFYTGELDGVSPEGLTIRKAYPTAGHFKKVEIPQGDIQSIHLGP